jgi:hypothetical protein
MSNDKVSNNRVIIELEPHSILPMREAKGARLECIDGAVWITEEGNRNDFILEHGDAHALADDGRAVVQAIGAARIALESSSEATLF